MTSVNKYIARAGKKVGEEGTITARDEVQDEWEGSHAEVRKAEENYCDKSKSAVGAEASRGDGEGDEQFPYGNLYGNERYCKRNKQEKLYHKRRATHVHIKGGVGSPYCGRSAGIVIFNN